MAVRFFFRIKLVFDGCLSSVVIIDVLLGAQRSIGLAGSEV